MARPLHEITGEIVLNWPEPYFGALPCVKAKLKDML